MTEKETRELSNIMSKAMSKKELTDGEKKLLEKNRMLRTKF